MIQISIYLHDQEMGYVQGMHNIVYRLLQLFTEEEAFYIFLGVDSLLSLQFQITEFLPAKFYSSDIEGIYSMHSAVADILKEEDSFFYQVIEKNTGDFIVFSSPYFKWIANIFTHPFIASFSFQFLDLAFSLGSWSLTMGTVALLLTNRDQLMRMHHLEEVEATFQNIAEQMENEDVPLLVRRVYELCLRTNVHSVLLYQQHHKLEYTSQSQDERVLSVMEEQNGIVGDLCKGSKAALRDSRLSLENSSSQLSLHVKKLSQSLKRVSGFESAGEEGHEYYHSIRSSLVGSDPDHIPSFNEFVDVYEEESDDDAWRTSLTHEDNSVCEIHQTEMDEESSEEEIVLKSEKEGDHTSQSSSSTSKFSLSFPLKIKPADQLLNKVGMMYDNLTERYVYRNMHSDTDHVVSIDLNGDGLV